MTHAQMTPAVKATLEFDLTNPDGQMAFDLTVDASGMRKTLRDLDNELRNIVKYNPNNLHGHHVAGLEQAREMLNALCIENRIHLDEL